MHCKIADNNEFFSEQRIYTTKSMQQWKQNKRKTKVFEQNRIIYGKFENSKIEQITVESLAKRIILVNLVKLERTAFRHLVWNI